MAIATASRKISPTVSVTPKVVPVGSGLVLRNSSWEEYLGLGELLAAHPLRLSFHLDVLEIMVISPEHERYKHLLGRLIIALTEELFLLVAGFGSMTFLQKKKRGLEPDECYWIANAAKIRNQKTIDLDVDPPADLAVEIDLSASSVQRMSIYAALKVPEVWRFDGTKLTFHVLGKGKKKYREAANSVSFPRLTPADVETFLNLLDQKDENSIVREFRVWIRENLATAP